MQPCDAAAEAPTSSASVAMTEEEEAELLATYGSRDIYDDLPCLRPRDASKGAAAAPSMFLTGTSIMEGALSDERAADEQETCDRNPEVTTALPLDVLLMRLFSDSCVDRFGPCAATFATNLINRARTLQCTTSERLLVEHNVMETSTHASEMRLLGRYFDDANNGEAAATQDGTPTLPPEAKDDADDVFLQLALKDLDDLVREAEAEVVRDHRYDRTKDPDFIAFEAELQGEVEALRSQREVELSQLCDSDDENSRIEPSELAAIEAQAGAHQSLEHAKEREDAAAMVDAKVYDLSAQEDAMNRIMCARKAVVETPLAIVVERVKEELRAHHRFAPEKPDLWSHRSSSALVLPAAPLLDPVAEPETLAAEMPTPLKQHEVVSYSSAAHRASPHEARVAASGGSSGVPSHVRIARGDETVEIATFASQIECLIPTSELEAEFTFDGTDSTRGSDETELAHGKAQSSGSVHVEGKSRRLQSGKKKMTVARMAARAQRQSLFLQCEAHERRRMLAEDEKVKSQIRAEEQHREEWQRAINDTMALEANRRRDIDSSAHLQHVDILTREQRQRTIVRQYLEHQAMQRAAKAESQLVSLETSGRTQILDIESYEWLDFKQLFVTEGDRVRLELAERLRQAEERAVAHRTAIKAHANRIWDDITGSGGASGIQRSAHSRAIVCESNNGGDGDAFGAVAGSRSSLAMHATLLRRDSLAAQVERRAQCGVQASSLRATLVAAQQVVSRQLQLVPSHSSRKVKTSVSHDVPLGAAEEAAAHKVASAGGSPKTSLNAKRIRAHHSHLFSAAAANTSSLRHIFAKLVVSMEGLDAIDGDNISTELVAEPSGVPVATFVSEMDLSGNAIHELSLRSLHTAFPQLKRLRIRDNDLSTIRSDPTAGSTSLLLSTLLHFDASANKLSSLEFLSCFPELRSLSLFSNKLSSGTGELARCPNMSTLELNRNSLTEIEGVRALGALTLLDVSRNLIDDLSSIGGCPLLEAVFASHNRLTAFPVTPSMHLPFLQQLFLSENEISCIPMELGWLPMISVLHLDSNKLTSLEGLPAMSTLTRLHLAFNQLQDLHALRPVLACVHLATLSINDNPVTVNPTTRKAAHEMLRAALPQLRELDHEPTNDSRVAGPKDLGTHLAAAALLMSAQRAAWGSGVIWPRHNHKSSSSSSSVYTELSNVCFSAAASAWRIALGAGLSAARVVSPTVDAHIRGMRDEVDTVSRRCNNRLQVALAREEDRFTRSKARSLDQLPLPSLLLRTSDDIWMTNLSTRLQLAQRQLQAFLDGEQGGHSTVNASSGQNMFVRHPTYNVRAAAFHEERSRRVIADFLYYGFLRLKAKRQLEELRHSSVAYYQKRLAWAATVIQPLWRGALVRSRLRKVRMDDLDGDDATLFAKVSPWDRAAQLDMSNYGSVAAMMQVAMQHKPHVESFAIPAPSRPPRLEQRVGSAPHQQVNGPSDAAGDGAPTAGSHRPSSSGPQSLVPQRPGFSSPAKSSVDSEWGEGVAMLLKRKEKKIERAKGEQLRKEFLKDPLKARQRKQEQH